MGHDVVDVSGSLVFFFFSSHHYSHRYSSVRCVYFFPCLTPTRRPSTLSETRLESSGSTFSLLILLPCLAEPRFAGFSSGEFLFFFPRFQLVRRNHLFNAPRPLDLGRLACGLNERVAKCLLQRPLSRRSTFSPAAVIAEELAVFRFFACLHFFLLVRNSVVRP